MPVVLLMVIGAAAGYLASRLMGYRTDVPTTMFLGVIGALVLVLGQFVFERVLHMQSTLAVLVEMFGGLLFLALVLRKVRT